MKIRGLIVAALVFFILGGILYWSEHKKPSDDKASADASPAILKLDASAVTKLDLKKRGADPIALTKSNGKWDITQPHPFGADQSLVSGMLSRLASLNSERVVEDKAGDVTRYGLNPPVLQLDIAEKGKTRQLLIGDDTPTGSAAYAMVAGDPRVFTMPAYEKVGLNKSLNDLRDKRLLTMDPDKISRLELIRKNQDIEFGRGKDKDDWQILKPNPLRADSNQVSELVRKLTDAKMDLSSSDPKEAESAFAHAMPVATAKLTDESGTQELEVRKRQVGTSSEAYYAKSSVVDGVYKINSDVGPALDKGLDDFRDKKLFDFGFTEPNKIELHVGSKAYFLVRGGDDWWWNGKKMDAESVQSLLSKLRDLAADKFPDSGFISPTIDVTVTSDNGKRIERVQIAKSGESYIAKRENEPALYGLNSSSVDDLQKTADEIKAAATGTK